MTQFTQFPSPKRRARTSVAHIYIPWEWSGIKFANPLPADHDREYFLFQRVSVCCWWHTNLKGGGKDLVAICFGRLRQHLAGFPYRLASVSVLVWSIREKEKILLTARDRISVCKLGYPLFFRSLDEIFAVWTGVRRREQNRIGF